MYKWGLCRAWVLNTPTASQSNYPTIHLAHAISLMLNSACELKQAWQWPQLPLVMKRNLWSPFGDPWTHSWSYHSIKVLTSWHSSWFLLLTVVFVDSVTQCLRLCQGSEGYCKTIWHCSGLGQINMLALTWQMKYSLPNSHSTSALTSVWTVLMQLKLCPHPRKQLLSMYVIQE